jgi:hypothetical protein
MASQDPWRSFVQGILRKQNNKIIIQVLEKILWSEFAKARQTTYPPPQFQSTQSLNLESNFLSPNAAHKLAFINKLLLGCGSCVHKKFSGEKLWL